MIAHDHTEPAIAATFLAGTLPARLQSLREQIAQQLPDIVRIGIFLIDTDRALLTTWADSDGRILACPAPVAGLPANPALSRCGASGRAQTTFIRIDPALEWATGERSCPLITLPVSRGSSFHGFLVIESNPAVALPAHAIHQLLAWGPLAAGLLAQGIESAQALIGTTHFALDVTLSRDRETGEHQFRLRDYILVLATELSAAHGLNEAFIAELALFGPLHDIGKICIPDAILRKPGRFEPREWELMKAHVTLGRDLIERMIDEFELHDTPSMQTLHEVVTWHHERLDGSGYPDGLRGDAIPLGTRIVSTADVFDALTSVRPYKRSWSMDEAFAQLQTMAGDKLDRDCVDAMLHARQRIETVWRQHASGSDAAH